jgi:hypothetical protein
MKQEILKKVIKVMRDLSYQTEEKTGIQTSIEEQDIKSYFQEILEVSGKEKKEGIGNSKCSVNIHQCLIAH